MKAIVIPDECFEFLKHAYTEFVSNTVNVEMLEIASETWKCLKTAQDLKVPNPDLLAVLEKDEVSESVRDWETQESR